METIPSPETAAYWLGCEGDFHLISFQGQLFTWKCTQPPRHFDPGTKRGGVTEFSRASRLRMLKLVATIDWQRAGSCLFVTLTFPDEGGKPDRKTINQGRAVFWRAVENHFNRKIPCLWRLEWEIRKSGKLKGDWMPHYHLIAFGLDWLPTACVRDWWKQAIACPITPRTNVKKMVNPRQVGFYVAKYAAKVSCSVLVNAAYHNNYAGRLWGVLRKNLLPVHPKQEVRVPRSELTDLLRAELLRGSPEIDADSLESFTFFGPKAVLAGYRIFGKEVDFRTSFG